MNKKIKTTDNDIRISSSTIEVIDINGIRFEHDEQLYGVQVYILSCGGEEKEFLEEIEETEPIVGFDDLSRVALNWYFNNVEIVKEVTSKSGV